MFRIIWWRSVVISQLISKHSSKKFKKSYFLPFKMENDARMSVIFAVFLLHSCINPGRSPVCPVTDAKYHFPAQCLPSSTCDSCLFVDDEKLYFCHAFTSSVKSRVNGISTMSRDEARRCWVTPTQINPKQRATSGENMFSASVGGPMQPQALSSLPLPRDCQNSDLCCFPAGFYFYFFGILKISACSRTRDDWSFAFQISGDKWSLELFTSD